MIFAFVFSKIQKIVFEHEGMLVMLVLVRRCDAYVLVTLASVRTATTNSNQNKQSNLFGFCQHFNLVFLFSRTK